MSVPMKRILGWTLLIGLAALFLGGSWVIGGEKAIAGIVGGVVAAGLIVLGISLVQS